MKPGRCSFACRSWPLALSLLLFGLAREAGAEQGQLDPLHPSLRACATLRNNGERLACYDRTIANAVAGGAPGTPASSAQEMFGMTQSTAPESQASEAIKREAINEITARVKELRERSDGALFIVLDNGQTWLRTDSRESLALRAGEPVKIMRAAFGSFRLVTENQRFAKVTRVK